jgi:hypothetical protein
MWNFRMKNYELILKYEEIMEHMKWAQEIPYISFPSDWEVKITPPRVGAVVRFRVKKGDAEVSIYLDCYDNLGCVGYPYWEVYPYEEDVFRCDMLDTESLLRAIGESISGQSV